MNTGPVINEAMEELSLLLEELGISSILFYQSVLPTLSALRSGRALKAFDMNEKLRLPKDYLAVISQVLPEMEKSFGKIKTHFTEGNSTAEWSEIFSNFEKETNFYRQFQEASGRLMEKLQKLNRIAQEVRLSSPGMMPIDEAWEELKRLADKF